MIRRSVFILFCVALIVMSLSACGLRPKPVTIKTYVVDSQTKLSSKLVAKPYPYTLILAPVLGALPLRTRRILYRSSDITLGPYLYSRWAYAPTHMLMVKFLSAFNQSGLFRAVAYRATGARGNIYLETTLLDFTQHLSSDGKTSYGVISAIFSLIDDKTRDIIATKTLTVKKPAPTLDANGAATALNDASDALCMELVGWLGDVMKSLPETPKPYN